MACQTCAPQGVYAQYEVDRYGVYGPIPSKTWPPPSVEVGSEGLSPGTVAVIAGVLLGTILFARFGLGGRRR
ncbi:MAG: hypothetical protein PHI12_12635 [Dehalococcoidales bacterium]|nr:hypothetical protein [Dehalococcoidales bacterium]